MAAIVSKGVGGPQTGQHGPERAPGRFWGRLVRAISRLLKRQHYEPARHYMRGPGPASSRSKQKQDGKR